jgi:hypothetical protein
VLRNLTTDRLTLQADLLRNEWYGYGGAGQVELRRKFHDPSNRTFAPDDICIYRASDLLTV